jgi:hypothetical protein
MFTAGEKQPPREKSRVRDDEDGEREVRRQRRPFN